MSTRESAEAGALVLSVRLIEAFSVAEYALELASDLSLGYRVLYDVYHRTEDYLAAIASYERVLELDPGNAQALEGLETSSSAASLQNTVTPLPTATANVVQAQNSPN